MTGQVTTEKTVKTTGREKIVLEDRKENTVVGPFCVDSSHAEVEANVKVTISENYQSVTLGASVRIPVPPNEKGVKDGLDWAFATAQQFLDRESAGAKEALKG